MRLHGDLARGLRCRVAGDRSLYGRGRTDQPLRDLRRGRPRRRARKVRRAQPSGAAAGKCRKPSRRPLHDLLRGPRLGRDGGDTGRRLFHRRSPSGREHRDPKRSRCRNREHAGRRRDRCQGHDVGRHRDPRGASCSQSYPRLGSRISGPRRSTPTRSASSEINADNRIAARVAFDLDDIDAAFAELDARYLAGEAAAHAHTWSVIAEVYAAAQSTANFPRRRRTA